MLFPFLLDDLPISEDLDLFVLLYEFNLRVMSIP